MYLTRSLLLVLIAFVSFSILFVGQIYWDFLLTVSTHNACGDFAIIN